MHVKYIAIKHLYNHQISYEHHVQWIALHNYKSIKYLYRKKKGVKYYICDDHDEDEDDDDSSSDGDDDSSDGDVDNDDGDDDNDGTVAM